MPLRTLLPPVLFAILLPAVPPAARGQDADDAKKHLAETLRASGIRLDLEQRVVSVPASVLVRDDLLEYLLVGPRGATHEGLFLTEVAPSLINAALLALGVEPGRNARWIPLDEGDEGDGGDAEALPDDREGNRDAELIAHPPEPLENGGLFLYVGWREEDETYFYRVDDVVSNLDTGRSMRRHPWVFLGSRFRSLEEGEPEIFVADLEQNLISISFFFQGNTLVTASLPECLHQTIWAANPWLLPARDEPVELFFSTERMTRLPDGWAEELPRVAVGLPGEDTSDAR